MAKSRIMYRFCILNREAASQLFKRHELDEAIMDLDKMMQSGILVEEHARLKLLLKEIVFIIIENSDNLEKKSWDLESKVRTGNQEERGAFSSAEAPT